MHVFYFAVKTQLDHLNSIMCHRIIQSSITSDEHSHAVAEGCNCRTALVVVVLGGTTPMGDDGIDNDRSDAEADLGTDLPPESDKERSVTTVRSLSSRAIAVTLGADLDGTSNGRNGPNLS